MCDMNRLKYAKLNGENNIQICFAGSEPYQFNYWTVQFK